MSCNVINHTTTPTLTIDEKTILYRQQLQKITLSVHKQKVLEQR